MFQLLKTFLGGCQLLRQLFLGRTDSFEIFLCVICPLSQIADALFDDIMIVGIAASSDTVFGVVGTVAEGIQAKRTARA